MRAYERLLNYVKVWTTSDEESTTSPTTARQFDLAKLLLEEMKGMGIEDAMMDEYGYVYGHIPATPVMRIVQPSASLHIWIPHRITVERM